MADATPPPALPSTADTTPYVPVSWMAVAAATVAGLFVVVLFALGISAFIAKKPLVIPELLIFAVAGLVLSFAGRRVIRNSEGTRTGVNLVNAAWWVSLLVGLGYAAYLFGVDFSVRRDAQDEAVRWVGYLVKPELTQTDVNRALIRTIEPGGRNPFNPEDTATLKARQPELFLTFNQSDLVRIALRNTGACDYTPGGLKDWLSKPGLIECSVVGTLRCPEGVFPLEVPLRGFDAGVKSEAVGRQWQVVLPEAGFVQKDKVALTGYGWLLADLEQSGGEFGRRFVEQSAANAASRAYLYQVHIHPDPAVGPAFWDLVPMLGVVRGVARVDPMLILPFTKEYQAYVQERFARAPAGSELSSSKKAQFARSWLDYGLLLPGRRLPNNDKVDAHNVLSVTDSAVEVRVPCEIPLSGAGGNLAAARGRLVVASDDPALMAELKRLRAEANPDKATTTPPADFRRTPVRWRVVGIETDMAEVQVQRGGPGGAGGPTGMPGMGG